MLVKHLKNASKQNIDACSDTGIYTLTVTVFKNRVKSFAYKNNAFHSVILYQIMSSSNMNPVIEFDEN